MSSPGTPEPVQELEDTDLFDYALIRDWVGFALRSIARHPWVFSGVAAAMILASYGALRALPKTYHVETWLLAQRNQVINMLGNPGRSVPYDADAPTRAASETVLQRANLILLIKQTDLIDNWERTRAPAVRVRDWIKGQFSGPISDEDRTDALIGILEKRLTVETGDQTVTIAIDWPDAETAFRLVEAAQQDFLEARHVTEIAVISEAISILEGHATAVHEVILSTMDELKAEAGEAEASAPAPGGSSAPHPQSKPSPQPPKRKPEDQEVAQLRVMLASKQQAIHDVEDFRQHRLMELQSQLTEAKAIYAPAHPNVLNIQQSIDALSQESPQVTSLRKEATELENELNRRIGKPDLSTTEPPKRDPATQHKEVEQALKLTRKPTGEADDVALEYTRSRLRQAMQQYDSLLDRIDGARMELDTARAAFKYRYSVIRPAEIPRSPEKPKASVMMIAGTILGVLLGLTTSLLVDLRSGRIFERWQVERLLDLKILGEVHRS